MTNSNALDIKKLNFEIEDIINNEKKLYSKISDKKLLVRNKLVSFDKFNGIFENFLTLFSIQNSKSNIITFENLEKVEFSEIESLICFTELLLNLKDEKLKKVEKNCEKIIFKYIIQYICYSNFFQ